MRGFPEMGQHTSTFNCKTEAPMHYPTQQHAIPAPASGRQSADHEPASVHLHSDCCGARTRKGTPCKSKVLYRGGRCKLHGGLSTGPKTKKGKAASRRNGKKGGRPRKNRQTERKDTA
ncbi:HGGxSTG domain-containing protein [Comamonas aquatica]|uniref:HGGxSTG domain-containing protein n=1 Tax=Comamonas aquatica TaxID=225991 RepID=UPI003083FB0A